MPKTRGIIAAGNPATAEAAEIALLAGGNAFDAAVAAIFASFIGEPCMSSPGGGGFMTAVTAEGKSFVLDFFVQTPVHKKRPEDLDFFPYEINFGTATEVFYIGMGACGVPGSIAGIYEIHDKFCRLPIKDLAAPSIRMAREGVILDDFQAHDFKLLKGIMAYTPAGEALYCTEGNPKVEGDLFQLPELSDFLDTLVNEGRDLFYKGEISALIESMGGGGGSLQRSDFSHYEAIFRKPMAIPYRQFSVITNPPPSIGGGLLAYGLERLWPKDKPDYRPQSREHLACVMRALREMDELHLDDERLQRELSRLSAGQFKSAGNALGGTTHFSVMDELGNAVSVSLSNGEGNGYVVEGTGFMMNNMLGETALLPDGLHSWIPDARLSSMMAPTVATDGDGHPILIMGSGGAGRIPGAILQTLHNVLDLDMELQDAVNLSRMHWRKNTLNLEPGWPEGFPENPREVIQWPHDMFFGGIHAVGIDRGHLTAIGDDRRSGVSREVQ